MGMRVSLSWEHCPCLLDIPHCVFGKSSICIYGGFLKQGYPKMSGFWWNILLRWIIWGYPHGLETSICYCITASLNCRTKNQLFWIPKDILVENGIQVRFAWYNPRTNHQPTEVSNSAHINPPTILDWGSSCWPHLHLVEIIPDHHPWWGLVVRSLEFQASIFIGAKVWILEHGVCPKLASSKIHG